MEPTVDTGARTTATSATEGRLKVDSVRMKGKKKTVLKDVMKKYC